MSFTDTLLAGATLQVESTVLPPITIDLTPDKDPSNQGGVVAAVLKFVRPQVTVLKGGSVVATEAPYGDPNDAPPWGLVILLGSALLTAVGIWLITRK